MHPALYTIGQRANYPQCDNKSGGLKGLFDGRDGLADGEVVGETEDGGAVRSYESSCAVEPLEAERRDATDHEKRGAFERTRLGRRDRLELKAGGDVVSEDVQLLPGSVRTVRLARDGG